VLKLFSWLHEDEHVQWFLKKGGKASMLERAQLHVVQAVVVHCLVLSQCLPT
jgi:hypothetical protein